MFSRFRSKGAPNGLNFKQCPSCNGFIKKGAVKCKHCGSEFRRSQIKRKAPASPKFIDNDAPVERDRPFVLDSN